jgi:hypothetical protein
MVSKVSISKVSKWYLPQLSPLDIAAKSEVLSVTTLTISETATIYNGCGNGKVKEMGSCGPINRMTSKSMYYIGLSVPTQTTKKRAIEFILPGNRMKSLDKSPMDLVQMKWVWKHSGMTGAWIKSPDTGLINQIFLDEKARSKSLLVGTMGPGQIK